jgi:hypothetical protein
LFSFQANDHLPRSPDLFILLGAFDGGCGLYPLLQPNVYIGAIDCDDCAQAFDVKFASHFSEGMCCWVMLVNVNVFYQIQSPCTAGSMQFDTLQRWA